MSLLYNIICIFYIVFSTVFLAMSIPKLSRLYRYEMDELDSNDNKFTEVILLSISIIGLILLIVKII